MVEAQCVQVKSKPSAGFSFLLVGFSFEHNEAVKHPSSLYDAKGNLTACGGYYQSLPTGNSDGDQSVKQGGLASFAGFGSIHHVFEQPLFREFVPGDLGPGEFVGNLRKAV